MAWAAPATRATGDLITAAIWNADVVNNPLDLDRRTGLYEHTVGSAQTTSSTSYTDLATSGPTRTVTTGVAALVIITGLRFNNGANSTFMSFEVSGATTLAASDARSLENQGTNGDRNSAAFTVPLTAGSNTFTAKYRVGGGTGTFSDRQIIVLPLGA